jgi:pimeloyl-ACP methyl ester carboxylesterase
MNGSFRSAVLTGIALLCLGLVSGCTSVAEIRVHHGPGGDLPVVDADNPNEGCVSSSSTAESRAYSIEDYKDYWAGFVEFDDEGWLYTSKGQPNQMQVVQARLKKELNDARYEDLDFLVVAFVHGWHHNAHDTDCNVHEFRAMLKVLRDRYAAVASQPDRKVRPRRIVGVYAGWRGESVDIDGLNVTTVLDRRNAAERVAKGDVRELFAQLRKLQIGESQKSQTRADRMRTVVIGHSFGGLIAFHGLSPAVLNELTLTKPEEGCRPTVYRRPSILPQTDAGAAEARSASAETETTAPVFPNKLILINPAFEATRFETLHELMRPTEGCSYPEDGPKLVVVTADNDSATGPIFHAGRKLLTLLEAYPREGDSADVSRERDANTHAIGFTERYKTHRLCLVRGADGKMRAAASLTPPRTADWDRIDPYAPVWVVGAPPEIVDNHNGFFFAKRDPASDKQQPYLLDWIVSLHLYGPGPKSPAMIPDNGCPPG